MVRVEVKNFQSMVDEVIEIDGFSAVVGRSNIGKSAVVRAIKAALTGAPSDSYVRHSGDCPKTQKGAKSCKCFCSVRLMGPDLDLLWEKGDSVNRYVYNGVEHTAVSRGTPEFLGASFGAIELGSGEKSLLQVSDQFRPLFILDKSGTVVADVLSDVAKLDQINVAIRMAEKDRKEAASTRKVRDRDVSEIKLALVKYESLDSALSDAGDVAALGTKIERAGLRLHELDHYFESLTAIARSFKQLSAVTDVRIPEATPVMEQGAAMRRIDTLGKRLQEKMVAVKGLSGVPAVMVPSIDAFGGLSSAFKNLTKWSGQIHQVKAFVDRTRKTDAAAVPEFGGLADARTAFSKLTSWANRLESVSKSASTLRQTLEIQEKEESEVLAEFASLGVCPTCKQGVQAPGHKHQEAATHA